MWNALGRTLFWLTWPVLWIYLYNTERTRVIVTDGQKILVVKPWLGDGKWLLPGGGLKRGELPRLGAVRELTEEVGLQIEPLKFLGKINGYSTGFRYTVHLFHGTADSAHQLRPGKPEIRAAVWLQSADITAATADQTTLAALAKLASTN